MLIEDGFEAVIGLDPSLVLLQSARVCLRDHFYPVRGVAENIPFRDGAVGGVITCYSLRDVQDRDKSIREFARIVKKDRRLEIVDVGKPDDLFLRGLMAVYVILIMPILAKVLIGARSWGNPFRMIIPTFHRLATNQNLTGMAKRVFGSARLQSFLLGGLIIVEAGNRSVNQF